MKVDVKLYKEVPRSGGGGGQTRLLFVQDIRLAVENSGSLQWTVPDDAAPLETYTVLVLVSGSTEQGTPIFQYTPVFAIRAVPMGTCQPGFVSANGMEPGCSACSKGSYVSHGGAGQRGAELFGM